MIEYKQQNTASKISRETELIPVLPSDTQDDIGETLAAFPKETLAKITKAENLTKTLEEELDNLFESDAGRLKVAESEYKQALENIHSTQEIHLPQLMDTFLSAKKTYSTL